MLSRLENYLLEVAPPLSGLRPFVCDGSPLDCDVALVGYNPATTLEADFWDFWIPGRGFDKARWYNTYKRERQSAPLKPGKTRRISVSPTRKRIELFVNGLGDYKCIETNLYWDASADIASHSPIKEPPIDGLLRHIPTLKIVICHHKDAYLFLSSRIGSIEIKQIDHFANRRKGWNDTAAFELGARMQMQIGKLGDKSNG